MKSKTVIAGSVNELKDNEMRMVTITDLDREILICRINGEFYALSPFCTHYGAPLEEGILSNGRIICPWHHACFDSKTLINSTVDKLPTHREFLAKLKVN